MTRKNRTVANRLKALQPVSPVANVSLFGVREMYSLFDSQELNCTISEHCRTRVFEFPRIDFRPAGDEPHHEIYVSPTVQAWLTSDLVGYFTDPSFSKHYEISPTLRHMVGETDEKIRSQQKGRVPVFLVVEELNQLTPVNMIKGECRLLNEIEVRDGESEPLLIGGREGEKFIIAQEATDGAWPDIPNNQRIVNMILAGVRIGQQTAQPISKYIDLDCLVTDDGRFVSMGGRLTVSAGVTITTPMDANAYRGRVAEIRRAISTMEKDMSAPHMALLFNAIYREEYEEDAYQRLQYLQLWKSLVEAGPRLLGYQGDIRNDNVALAGNKTLRELKDYRDDIAHWWRDTIDAAYLADLVRTLIELLHRKYF